MSATVPVTCGEAWLVPWLIACMLVSRRAHPWVNVPFRAVLLRAEPTPIPGAEISGFSASSRSGPGLENGAMPFMLGAGE